MSFRMITAMDQPLGPGIRPSGAFGYVRNWD